MGFTEMPTNNYVESAFWNFDALFQPQQHPARDAQDTFYVSDPETCLEVPEDYLERVCIPLKLNLQLGVKLYSVFLSLHQ